jgi:hypothetical protein
VTWKHIADAPRDGTWLDLGHTDFGFTECGRWGVHRTTGQYRWVDGNGIGLFDATHWDFPRVPPKRVGPSDNSPLGVAKARDPWHVEYDDNGDPYSIYDRQDLQRRATNENQSADRD